MRLRAWILIGLAAVVLIGTGAPVFRDQGNKNAEVAKVFATVVAQRYPGWIGEQECVPSPQPGHDVCWAELHHGNRYRQIEIGIDLTTSSPVPSAATIHAAWTRQSVPIATRSGSGIANSPEYDWDVLMRAASAGQLPTTVVAVNGDATGFAPTLFTFRCTGVPGKITCANAIGDTITYARRV